MSDSEKKEQPECGICGGRVPHRHVVSDPILPNGPITSYERLKARNNVLTAALLKLSGLTDEQLMAAAETLLDNAKEGRALEQAKRPSGQSVAGSSPDQPEVPPQRGEHSEGVRELGRTEPPVDGEPSEAGEPSGETAA